MRHQNLNKVNVLPTRQASSIQILFVLIFVLVSILWKTYEKALS